MDSRIKKALRKIRNAELRRKVSEFLGDISVEIEGKTYRGMSIEESPASKFRHHSYRGGLLEHTASAVNFALAMCDSVETIYEGKVNRDLTIAGVILHDMLKPVTYAQKGGLYFSSPLGERIDHLTLMVAEMMKRRFPLELIHIVAASHGEGGPTRPRTVEALICHLADAGDSQLNGEVLSATKYLVKEATGEFPDIRNSKMAFEIIYSKTSGGWDKLRDTIERIREQE